MEIIKDTICKTLKKYGWEYTDEAIDKIVQTWYNNKKELISIFEKHPFYVKDKYYLVFDHDYDRDIDTQEVCRFYSWLSDIVNYSNNRTKYSNSIEKFKKICHIDHFLDCFYTIFTNPNYISKNLNDIQVEYLDQYFPEIKCKKGQKTARVINKILTAIKVNEHPDYNKEFAKVADALSPIKYSRHTVISLNPVDYLLMSNGNSWSSCHTIDVRQYTQSSYRGESCNGPMSYLLDKTSIVFYTVDQKYNGKDFEIQPKINRQMFHFSKGKLLQARLYPQNNDGTIGDMMREQIRNVMQKVIADCLSVPNLWALETRQNYIDHFYFTHNLAVSFPDYMYEKNHSTISFLRDIAETDTKIEIGAPALCINCGNVNTNKDSLWCECCNGDCNNEDEEDGNIEENYDLYF